MLILGAKRPIDWVTTSPCFHNKNNATGICYAENHFQWNEKTTIGNDVWIGERATILSGLTIGDGAVIGGESVVTKNIGSYEIWAVIRHGLFENVLIMRRFKN